MLGFNFSYLCTFFFRRLNILTSLRDGIRTTELYETEHRQKRVIQHTSADHSFHRRPLRGAEHRDTQQRERPAGEELRAEKNLFD